MNLYRMWVTVGLAGVCAAGVPYLGSSVQAQERADTEFGRDHSDLSIEQRALLDDFFTRFAEVTGESIDPEEAYGMTRMFVRTTFEAVTHALQTTTLTDDDGESLGTGLDLIDHVETVRGRVRDTGTDQQFRLYARLVLPSG